MKDKILINLGTDHTCECATDIIGREGEGNTTRLEINFPEVLAGCSVYLDFEKPNGEKITTPKLEVEDGVIYYDVVPYLLDDNGTIKVQVVLKTESGQTWKSSKKKFTILKSINAVDDIPEKEDFLSETQKLIDALNQEIQEVARVIANDSDFAVACREEFEEIVFKEKKELYEWTEITKASHLAIINSASEEFLQFAGEKFEQIDNSVAEFEQGIATSKTEYENFVAEQRDTIEQLVDEIEESADNIAKTAEDLSGVIDGTTPAGVASKMKYTLIAKGSWDAVSGPNVALQGKNIISKTNFIKPNTRYLIKADGIWMDGFSNSTGSEIRFHHIATKYADGDDASGLGFIIHDGKILFGTGDGLYFVGLKGTIGSGTASVGSLYNNAVLTHICEGETITID